MFKETVSQLKTAFLVLFSLTILTGLFYPLTITALAQFFFPVEANGSLIEKKGKIVGSLFIGQYFSSPGYFWGRPSATSPFPYNGGASLGSNSAPSNPDFLATVQARILHLKNADALNTKWIPVDLVTASASGLDPDISPAAAFYQIPRIAKARHLSPATVRNLVQSHIQGRVWNLLGEPRVNVLQLNLALDDLK